MMFYADALPNRIIPINQCYFSPNSYSSHLVKLFIITIYIEELKNISMLDLSYIVQP